MIKTKNVIIPTVITILALICTGCIKKQQIINPINAKVAAQPDADKMCLSIGTLYKPYWYGTSRFKADQKLNDIKKTKLKDFYPQLFIILGKEATHIVLLKVV